MHKVANFMAFFEKAAFQVLHSWVDSWPYPPTLEICKEVCEYDTRIFLAYIWRFFVFLNKDFRAKLLAKLFTAAIYNVHNKPMFIPSKHFQPSLMYVSKVGAYLREAHFKRVSLLGRLHTLPRNIRLGWKGLLRTKALALAYHNIRKLP